MKAWIEQYIRSRLSPEALLVWVALDDPTQWERSEYTITHKRSKIAFWTAVGQFHPYRPEEIKDFFSRFERRVLRRKASQMAKAQFLLKLGGLE